MIQKHCFECGTALIERELENEGIEQTGKFHIRPNSLAEQFLNAFLDEKE